MDLLIIGCGRVGCAITKRLLELDYIKSLSLYNQDNSDALRLSEELGNKVNILKDLSNLTNFNYIIISLSAVPAEARQKSVHSRRNVYDIINDELKYNLSAIKSLIPALMRVPKKTSIIIVTNPVDAITNYLREVLGKDNVWGFGGELDKQRYEKEINKKLFCVGLHNKIIPLINSKSEKDYDNLESHIGSEVIDFLKEHSMTHEMTAIVFKNFFDKLNSQSKQTVHISAYVKDTPYGVKDISIILPWNVKKGKLLRPVQISPNKIERARLAKEVIKLKKTVRDMLEDN